MLGYGVFPILLFLFIFVPLAELFFFLKIGARIGLSATFLIIVLTGILGAALARWQGLRTLSKFRQSLAEGRLPHEEIVEGVLILVAAALLLTPGFLTDTVGFLLLVPVARAEIRRQLGRHLKSRIEVITAGFPLENRDFRMRNAGGLREEKPVKGRVVEGNGDE